MTNAQSLPAPTPRSIDSIIGRNVHQLMWSRQETQTLVATDWGMDQSTLSMKLRGKRPWFAAEIVAAAERYAVSVADLFDPKGPTLDYGSDGSCEECDVVSIAEAPSLRRRLSAMHLHPARGGF